MTELCILVAKLALVPKHEVRHGVLKHVSIRWRHLLSSVFLMITSKASSAKFCDNSLSDRFACGKRNLCCLVVIVLTGPTAFGAKFEVGWESFRALPQLMPCKTLRPAGEGGFGNSRTATANLVSLLEDCHLRMAKTEAAADHARFNRGRAHEAELAESDYNELGVRKRTQEPNNPRSARKVLKYSEVRSLVTYGYATSLRLELSPG